MKNLTLDISLIAISANPVRVRLGSRVLLNSPLMSRAPF